ncbi:hypothetical protein FF1_011699 [Malus domestica]
MDLPLSPLLYLCTDIPAWTLPSNPHSPARCQADLHDPTSMSSRSARPNPDHVLSHSFLVLLELECRCWVYKERSCDFDFDVD